MKEMITIFISTILIVVFTITLFYYTSRRKWVNIQETYLKRAKEIYHAGHRQNTIMWLQSYEAEEIYLYNPKNFESIYQQKVDEIGEEIIERLTKKYTDEYKHKFRNT